MRTAALLCLVFLAPAPAEDSGPILLRDDVDHERSIEAARAYSGLAHLNFVTPRGFHEGEATLIAPTWLVTAAHVTDRLELGHRVSVGGEDAGVAEVIRHPDWRPDSLGTPDIALVRLETPISRTSPVPAYRGRAEVGLEVVLLGLGDYGDGLTGPRGNDGRVRLATNRIDSVTAGWLSFDFDAPTSSEATEYEGVSGPGDSGGPALATLDGMTYLVGISSGQGRGTASGPGRYGVVEYYTRVSSFANWIDSVTSR